MAAVNITASDHRPHLVAPRPVRISSGHLTRPHLARYQSSDDHDIVDDFRIGLYTNPSPVSDKDLSSPRSSSWSVLMISLNIRPLTPLSASILAPVFHPRLSKSFSPFSDPPSFVRPLPGSAHASKAALSLYLHSHMNVRIHTRTEAVSNLFSKNPSSATFWLQEMRIYHRL